MNTIPDLGGSVANRKGLGFSEGKEADTECSLCGLDLRKYN